LDALAVILADAGDAAETALAGLAFGIDVVGNND
jgi:hypothetical protein